MKKIVIILISFCGFLVFLWVVARLTHIVDFYQIPSVSNKPTYEPGNIIIASRLKKPDVNTFICFKKKDKKSIWVFRCIGKPGDIVEIKNAAVYLNGNLLNEPYTWNEYYISQKELNTIQGYVDRFKYPIQQLNDSLYAITLSVNDLRNYHLNLKRYFIPRGQRDSDLFIDFRNLKYSTDNLGPIKVPKDCYFLLGDNRHDALDSRYIGFINSNEIISTVIR